MTSVTSFDPTANLNLVCVKVWCDNCGKSQGALQAAPVEQPAEQLQGAEGSC